MSTFHETAIAAAIAGKLPFGYPVIPTPSTDPGASGQAVAVTFTGSPGARLAIQVVDPSQLEDGSKDAPLADRLHPIFEAAVAVLGGGALGDGEQVDAVEVFTDAGTQVFDMVDAAGSVVARAAVRIDGSRAAASTGPQRLSRIAGVEMELVVEIGRTRMPVRDVLSLEPGRVVELDRAAGSPADIKLNGRLIGHGTVVVAEGDFAIRVERILDGAEAV
ncbi:flagellar motor switch protein FliN/FliY [Microbacterium phyllosphaerae]|uniref:Flagellar motor switch protein FliN/FliY n=1 Tax=Microbacterium phyllosphaerae TaxID=124798 RepID=A0ABS4WRY4_9MICO|nr:FliM/FliN family flagellar motor switch protein [Microbacterium phyllosphaerae]MBP2378981.1 flagellar motor switch protein FliN/FliY [Microbacterium phyllosphaerae]MCS3444314.1 flagellar motor switch protein FliN/FliY [Microbacterium phyllosphaerae]